MWNDKGELISCTVENIYSYFSYIHKLTKKPGSLLSYSFFF